MTIFWMCVAIVMTIAALALWLGYRSYVNDLRTNIGLLSDVNAKLNEDVDQKTGSVAQLFEMIESISSERTMYRSRTIKLEDAVEKGYGVPIRREVTKIVVDFSKLELVVFLAGVHKLLKASTTIPDAEFYVNLTKRLQSTLDKMPDDEEEKE